MYINVQASRWGSTLAKFVSINTRLRRLLARSTPMLRTLPGTTRFMFHTPHGTVRGTMGALPEGTMCAYCDENEAGYIPDGCCGPVCGMCLDLGLDHGFEGVHTLRLQRWIRAIIGWLSPRATSRHLTLVESVLQDPDLALHISQYVVTLTDGSEYWAMGDTDVASGVETASDPN